MAYSSLGSVSNTTSNAPYFNVTVSSKSGTTSASYFGIIAVILSVVAAVLSVIFILGATGFIPALASLVAISSLGISLGLTAAMTLICTINISLFLIMTGLGILLIRYAHSTQVLHLIQENNSQTCCS